MKSLFGIFFLTLFLFSCNESEDSLIYNNERGNILTENEPDPTANFEFTSELNLSAAVGSVEYGGIKIFSLWRKSKGCKKLGICEWFPKSAEDPIGPWEVGRDVASVIAYDSLNNIIPINFLFTEFPLGLTSQDLEFGIDEDFVIAVTPQMNLPFDTLKILADTLNFNSNIESYGGYTINIIGINN